MNSFIIILECALTVYLLRLGVLGMRCPASILLEWCNDESTTKEEKEKILNTNPGMITSAILIHIFVVSTAMLGLTLLL